MHHRAVSFHLTTNETEKIKHCAKCWYLVFHKKHSGVQNNFFKQVRGILAVLFHTLWIIDLHVSVWTACLWGEKPHGIYLLSDAHRQRTFQLLRLADLLIPSGPGCHYWSWSPWQQAAEWWMLSKRHIWECRKSPRMEGGVEGHQSLAWQKALALQPTGKNMPFQVLHWCTVNYSAFGYGNLNWKIVKKPSTSHGFLLKVAVDLFP